MDSGSGHPPIDAPIAGTPVLALSPLTQSYGSVVVGVSSDAKTFTVSNTGTAETGSINATVGGDFAITNNTCTAALGSGDTCAIDVVFTPSAASARSATLMISSSKGGTVSASLTGTGTTAGKLQISSPSQNLGSSVVGVTGTGSASFTITNTGAGATGSLTTTVGGVNPGDFTKVTDTCNGQTLAANATCTVTASFKPTDIGNRTATIDVTGSPGGDVSGALSGTGLAPALLTVTPTAQDFGSLIQGQSGTNQSFVVKNTGGVATTGLTTTVTGTNSTDFAVSSNTCTANQPLAAGASCTILVKFTPTTTAAETAVLNVAATTGGTATSTLTGAGLSPGNISIDPPTVGFADTVVGQNSQASVFTVTNNGASATSALAVSLAGSAPSEFKLVAGGNGCTGTLGAHATCTIAVTFSPDAGGPHTAQLQVAATTGGTAVSGLTGTGLNPAHLTINPTSNDYGSVAVGVTSTVNPTYTITNTGDQTSSAVTVALGGANAVQFGITASTCTGTLASLATCQVTLSFTPNSPGAKSATLQASATTGGTATATLFGNGNDSDLEIGSNGSLANFPTTNIGDTSAVQTFTVKNTGNSSSGAIAVAITGANAADYSQTNTCNILGAGATCVVSVTFKPSTTVCAEDATTGLCERDATITVSGTPGGTLTQPAVGQARPRLEVTEVTPFAGSGAEAISWPTATFTFPDTILNTSNGPSQKFNFTNNTATAQTITLTPAGGLTAPFHVTASTCTGTLAANGGNCSATVQFIPTAKTTATQTVTGTLGAGGAANTSAVTVVGTGIDSLQIACTAGTGCVNTPTVSFAFATTPTGLATPTETFTVTNPSGAPLTGSIQSSVTGPFHITSDGCAGTQNGSTCTLAVLFAPTTTGAATGTLTVTGNPGGTITAALTGTGVNPAHLTLSTSSVDFGSVFAGETSATTGEGGDKVITVTNAAGAAASSPVKFNFGGGGGNGSAGAFSLQPAPAVTGDCVNNTTVLTASQSCNIRVRFAANTTPSVFTTLNSLLQVSALTGLTGQNVSLAAKSVTDISLAPTTFDFGSKDAGTVTSQDFTVTNLSNSSLTFTSSPITPFVPASIGGSTAGLSIIANTCATLAKGATCKITVQYASTAGTFTSAKLTANFDNGSTSNAGVASSVITALGLNAASFTLTPASFFFGSVLEGQTGTTATFTLKNAVGSSTGTVGFSATTPNYVVTNGCGTTLAAGATCTITATFKPAITGTASARNEHFTAGTIQGQLTGEGLVGGNVTASSGVVSFASTVVGVASATQTITLQNTAASGQATIALSSAAFSNTDFAVTGGTCTTTLAAGANCTVILTFTPSINGVETGVYTASGVTTVSLNGTGLGQATLSAPSCVVTGSSPAQFVTFVGSNNGSGASNDFGSIAVGSTESITCSFANNGGVTSGSVATTFSGADQGQFALANNTCNGKTLAAGATCSFDLSFDPSTVGNKSAALNVVASPGGTQIFQLTGAGVNEATIGISPSTPVTLPSVPVGTAVPNSGSGVNVTSFTITNGGDVPTGDVTYTLSNGTDFELLFSSDCDFASDIDFPFTANGFTLDQMDPKSTCTVFVAFIPQSVAANLTTTLTVSETHDGKVSTVSNTITATSTAGFTTDTVTGNFGSGSVDTTVGTKTITFTNATSGEIGPLTTSLAGTNGSTDFSITDDECEATNLDPGDSCTVTVTFVPQSTGAKTAALTVSGQATFDTNEFTDFFAGTNGTTLSTSVTSTLNGTSNTAPVGP